MICALVDYAIYRRRCGRFAWGTGRSVMAAGWPGELPKVVLDGLHSGDGLMFQWFENWTSWVIMYVTSSEVSHVGVYVGDGRIFHMTTSGVRVEPLSAMFSPDIRILPWFFPEVREKGLPISEEEIARFLRESENKAYPWAATIWYGLRIVSGRPWPRYRLRFFVDVTIVALIVDACVRLFVQWPFMATTAYWILVLWNRLAWSLWPQAIEDEDSDRGTPGDLAVTLPYAGGRFFFDPRAFEEAYKRGGRIARGLPGWKPPRGWKPRLASWYRLGG